MKLFNIGFFSLIMLILIPSCSHNIPFNQDLWQSENSTFDENNKPTIRQKMVDDVLKIIEGKSKQEIVELLGDETDTDKYQDIDRTLVYVLGPERSYISLDYEWLLLEFDEKDNYISHDIVTD